MAIHGAFKAVGWTWLSIILGLIFILIAGATSAGKTQQQLDQETWRHVLLWTGVIMFVGGWIGWFVMKKYFEYKIIRKALT